MIEYLIGVLMGIFAALTLMVFSGSDQPSKSQIGYTYQQLKEMKAECEENLPRSTECSIVVYYLPQAELEKTE